MKKIILQINIEIERYENNQNLQNPFFNFFLQNPN
jgi:hypothetical protein